MILILSHCQWKKKTFCYRTTFQGYSRISEEGKLVYSSLLTVCHFLWIVKTLLFFQHKGGVPWSKRAFTISRNDLQIDPPHSFSIRMLLILWRWALFGSKALIIFPISFSVKVMLDMGFSVRLSQVVETKVVHLISEHWLAKKELKTCSQVWDNFWQLKAL